MSLGLGVLQRRILEVVGERPVRGPTLMERLGPTVQRTAVRRAVHSMKARGLLSVRTVTHHGERQLYVSRKCLPDPVNEETLTGVVCENATSWLARLEAKSVDAVITDPPYDLPGRRSMRRGTVQAPVSAPVTLGSVDADAVARELVRVCRGWVVVIGSIDMLQAVAWRRALEAAGARWKGDLVWHKTNAKPRLSGDGLTHAVEYGVYAWAGEGAAKPTRGAKHNVFRCAYPKTRTHETEKPAALMEALVGSFSTHRSLVVDPFHGSGSTQRACVSLGRRYAGCDIDPARVGRCGAAS